MLHTSNQRRYPFVYPKCPALAFSGSLPGNCSTCVARHIGKDDSQFPRRLSSLLLQCTCSSYPLVRILLSVLYFPSLTGGLSGTKLAFLIEDTGRDRPVVAVLFVKASLRVLYISSIYLLVYLHTHFAAVGSGQAVPKYTYLPLDFVC